MILSAVIPSLNRGDVLPVCLRSLACQKLEGAHSLEVVVADDGSAIPVSEVVKDFGIDVTVVRLEGGGTNVARNAGVKVTTGDVLAFLDDDVAVDPGWASAMLAAFARPDVTGVAGRIVLEYLSPLPPWWRPVFDGYLSAFDLGDEEQELGQLLPYGANCAVRRDAFEEVGGFMAGAGRAAGSLISGGETVFFARLRALGGKVIYVPEASVVHRQPASRLTRSFLAKRYYAQGATDAAMWPWQSKALALAEDLRMLTRVPATLVKNMAAGEDWTNAWLRACFAAGRITGHVRRTRTQTALIETDAYHPGT
jgi:glucosyl-dolichyl phosphate glucuronosyltransferase